MLIKGYFPNSMRLNTEENEMNGYLNEKKKGFILLQISCGLGNQMFQYAFYQSLLNRNKNVKIESEYYKRSKTQYQLEEIFQHVKVDHASQEEIALYEDNVFLRTLRNSKFVRVRRMYDIFTGKKYRMTFSNYASAFEPHFLDINSGYLIGFWQNQKYFQDIEEQIRYDFQFPDFDDDQNRNLAEQIKRCESISIHVRRGDYIFLSSLPKEFRIDKIISGIIWKAPIRTDYAICSKKYFDSAINYMGEKIANPVFFIFSDDIEWCRMNLNIPNVVYVDWNNGSNSFRDMQLMSMCKHNIICNSTFSWWGAYLNDNPGKIVVAPDKWTKINDKLFRGDIIPSTWISLPV